MVANLLVPHLGQDGRTRSIIPFRWRVQTHVRPRQCSSPVQIELHNDVFRVYFQDRARLELSVQDAVALLQGR